MQRIRQWTVGPCLLLLTLLVAGCAQTTTEMTATGHAAGAGIVADLRAPDRHPETVSALTQAVTPLQQRLKKSFEERAMAGLPIPSSVSFEYEVKPPRERVKEDGNGSEQVVQLLAKTTLHFEGPDQAGYDVWPALVVSDTLPMDAQGTVLAGDYSGRYRALLAAHFPHIWDEIEFGQESRTRTVAERFEIVYAQEETPASIQSSATGSATVESILMGLTFTGPQVDYTIGDTLRVRDFTVYDFEAGFRLDWTFGLRLPFAVGLAGPEMEGGAPGLFSSALLSQDWTERDFLAAGVMPEGGNEFVLRVDSFVGIRAILLEIDVCSGCYLALKLDDSASFAAPFGPDTYLPIPPIEVPIREWGLGFAALYAGLTISPQVGSTKITADWHYRPDGECGQGAQSAQGAQSGQVTYVDQATPIFFGPESACSGSAADEATMQLSNFRYWLDLFQVGFDATLDSELFGNQVWSGAPVSADIDLSRLTQSLSLGVHRECNWLLQCEVTGAQPALELSPPDEAEEL